MGKSPFRSESHKCRKLFRAAIARVLLLTHSTMAIWFTARVLQDNVWFSLLAVSIPLWFLEFMAVIYFRQGLEWNWFCPAFLCYILGVAPSFWVQRLHILGHFQTSTGTTNMTENPTLGTFGDVFSHLDQNATLVNAIENYTIPALEEQTMMILIILCRWLLPRGLIDRNSMSQLLIMYTAITADIIDISEIFQVKTATKDKDFTLVLLGFWTWSLFQFTLVATASQPAAQPPDANADVDVEVRKKKGNKNGSKKAKKTNRESFAKSEFMSLVMVFFMQDGPFFFIRSTLLIKYHVLNPTILFFYLKNIMTLILAMYRLLVLCSCVSRLGDDIRKSYFVKKGMLI